MSEDYAEAMRWFEHAAENGYRLSQYIVARKYLNGDGLTQDDKKDYVESVFWLKKAAEQGLDKAMFRLGRFYCLGPKELASIPECISWLERAGKTYVPAHSTS